MSEEQPTFRVHIATESDHKIPPTENSIDTVFPHPEYAAYLIGKKSEPGVNDNPYGAVETTLGAVQRMLHLQKQMPLTPEDTTPPAVNLAIESGILPTKGNYNSIHILQIKGKLTPDIIDNNTIRFPSDVTIQTFNPATHTRTTSSIKEAPFVPEDATIQPGDTQAAYPDRAIAVLYDPKTNTTFIGISQGVPFDKEDVRKTIIDDGGKKRVAENMRDRLIKEGKLTQDGHIIREGIATNEMFNVENPQRYIDPSLPREKQIGDLMDVLLTEVKTEECKTSTEYNISPERDLWRARLSFKNFTPAQLEEVLTSCARDDLNNLFRFSGYYFHDKESLIYQFTNNTRPSEVSPTPQACEEALAQLQKRLNQQDTEFTSKSATGPWQVPENPEGILEVPFGKTKGYTDEDKETIETFETPDIHKALGTDWKGKPFTITDANILSIGGTSIKTGEPQPREKYEEPVGLIIANNIEDIQNIYHAGETLGQEVLIFEMLQRGTAYSAEKKKVL